MSLHSQGIVHHRVANRPTPRHIIIKAVKVKGKEKILKAARKRFNNKITLIRLSADFSTETLQGRREWQNIFKTLKREKIYILEYSTQ